MSSNYPSGVTGGEYAISGEDEEFDTDTVVCENDDCEYEGEQTVYVHGSEAWFDCKDCEHRSYVDTGDLR